MESSTSSGPTLFLLVGLPGSGKTTRAVELERERHALRLAPDEWMLPLFGPHQPEADGRREIIEGRLIWLALRSLCRGVDVALDFGLWARDERSAPAHLAAESAAACELLYCPVEAESQRERLRRRQADPKRCFTPTTQELRRGRALFEESSADELVGRFDREPPPGWLRWEDWACRRWPTWITPAPPVGR